MVWGTIFRGEEISFKPYPCGRRAHATMDVALALYQQLDLATAPEGHGIAEVIVTTDPQTYRDQFAAGTTTRAAPRTSWKPSLVPHSWWPAASPSAKWVLGKSRQSTIHASLRWRTVSRGAAQGNASEGWAQITVRRTDGRTAMLETTSPFGSPALPLSDAQLHAKFRDCAAQRQCGRSLAEVVERAIQLVYHVEEIADVVELVRLFT